ncbi:MAG TPA: hypothetical protein VGJ82_18490 [Thermoanaerobaculia bacterium]
METLLINWVYHRPVGHVIEAMRLARDFAAANDQLEVSLLLNRESPIELARCHPSISRVYPIDLDRGLPKGLPREWDYVFTFPDVGTNGEAPLLDRFHEAFRAWVHARAVNDGWKPETMPPRKFAPLRLQLPEKERREAESRCGEASPRLSVLLAAGSHTRAPTLKFWSALFERFFERHLEGEVFLLGSFDRKRSFTRGISPKEIESLTRTFPRVRNAFDIGLLAQLAIAERCQLHISPHSGMSFAVQAAGVPWLAIAGQQWWEFLLNGVPLVSIFPSCPLYPCFREMYPECESLLRKQLRTPCMDDEALFAKMPEIVDAMESLLDGSISYRDSAYWHEEALRSRLGDGSILDWPHVVSDDYRF